jgi:luciferase family oxidoreductase group 1
MDLSILDFGHAGAAAGRMSQADELGFRRYWLGEHHSPSQCANPLLLGALLAAASGGIRIGSGGVCLTYHSPYRIAEDARLIEHLIPGRFDLGVTRGLALSPELRDAVLDGRPPGTLRGHEEKLADLHGFLTGRLPAGHPMAGQPLPLEPGPPLWVLGNNLEAARWAGRHGTGLCYSLHHSLHRAPDGRDGPAVLQEYRSSFAGSPEFPEPAAIVAVSLVCAATSAEAHEQRQRFDKAVITGSVADCWAGIEETADRFDAGEVMILDLLQDLRDGSETCRILEALADRAGLAPRDMG